MNTIAWMLILIGILLVRQVSKGRVMNLGEDLSDAFIATVSGDTAKLTEVLARTGEGNTVSESASVPNGTVVGSFVDPGAANNALLNATVRRGKSAKGYIFGAIGPEYYDCSGLVWRACQDLGFKGARFVTQNVANQKGFLRVNPPGTSGSPGSRGNVGAAGVGDIVCWPDTHMGVVSGPNQFYSAMNPQSGIGYSSISGWTSERPIYLRYKAG